MLIQAVFALLLTAENPALHEQANSLFQKIWSPYCPGVSLLECPSGKAQDLRDELRSRIASGETEDDIINSLYQTYGEEKLRMMPTLSGRESLAFWMPYVLALLGAFLLISVIVLRNKKLKRKSQASAPSLATQAPTDPKILEEIEKRLHDG